MNNWPKQDRASMCAFYGNPDANGDGLSDRPWEVNNLTTIKPPYRMVLAWDPSKTLSTIRCHKKVAESLLRVLNGILAHYGSQEAVEKARMHLYGGCWSFRPMRGGNALSVHSWGAAIDLDPEGNPFGGKVTMPVAVVDLFAQEGWTWGGPWRKSDGQHFQAANL